MDSYRFKGHERDYFAHDIELVAVIRALKIKWHHLYGERFLIYTDRES